ncbi:DUF2975 domain-containing protein [Candidatus Woesebacteria bacterium]|nr:DUF2975 domain-containing protein [Candidatus Woesebacteria bacterium]
MKQISTSFLKIAIILIGGAVLSGLIFFPQTEGRAKDLDLISIYLDPFILYIYIASLAFFAALFQAIKLLGFVENNNIFSPAAVHAVRHIKYCGVAMIGFIVGAQVFIMFTGEEDKAGPIAMGIYITILTCVVIAAADICERLLKNTISTKSKKVLTI